MSSPPWYMYLPYGISLPLQMCIRNIISPPKDVHKGHIEMTKGQREKMARDEGINNDNDAWGVREKWENEAQT